VILSALRELFDVDFFTLIALISLVLGREAFGEDRGLGRSLVERKVSPQEEHWRGSG
jgi:hypothetical protein